MGKVYQYANFSEEKFDDFKNAPSVGVYFGQNILNNPDHPFTCVDEGIGGVLSEMIAEVAETQKSFDPFQRTEGPRSSSPKTPMG